MESNPQISAVIATRNRRQMLLRSLQTLFVQDLPPERYEVIVVVDGSTDGTAEALGELHPACALRVLERPQGGISPARNDGIRAARGEIILILDDDVLCEPDLLRQHLAAHKNSRPQVVYGPLPVSPESPMTLAADCLRHGAEEWLASFAEDPRLRWPFDAAIEANTSIHRTVLREFGAFDETIPYQRDDAEIGMRFWKNDVPFRYLPTAVAHHVVVKKTSEMVSRDAPAFGKNDLRLARKIPEYRSFSVPARMAEGPLGMRALRRFVATLPLSPASLFCALLWPFEKLRRGEFFRRRGVKLLKYASSAVSFRSAVREAGSWSNLRREFGMRLPVLLYHHVGLQRSGAPAGLTVSPGQFARQVRWLARRGYTGIRPADWLQWRREGKGLPDKPVLLSFDDAYADLAEYALPVLRRYGLGAAVFVVTGRVGETNTWDPGRGSGTLPLMTAEQIRYWTTQGIEFGAHSRTHADLTTLDAKELTQEVIGSRNYLAVILGCRVTSFAYPYGFYNQAVYECVRGAFDLAFRVDEKTPGINLLGTDPHLLERSMVQSGDTLLDLACRVRWGYSPLLNLRIRLRGLFIKMFFGSAEGEKPTRSG